MEQKEEQRPIYPEAPEALMLPPPPTQGGTFMAASYTRSPAGVYGPAASYVRSPAGYGAPAYATYTQPAGSMYRAASPSPVYSAASPVWRLNRAMHVLCGRAACLGVSVKNT